MKDYFSQLQIKSPLNIIMRKSLRTLFLFSILGFSIVNGVSLSSPKSSLAGLPIPIKIDNSKHNAAQKIRITTPYAEDLKISILPNNAQQFILPGIYTTVSGAYTFFIGASNTQTQVLPREVSPYHSSLSLSKSVTKADGISKVGLHGKIRDVFGNPIPGVSLKLKSSRTYDAISHAQKSDPNGEFFAEVSSKIPGISTFTAKITDQILLSRPKLVFSPSGNQESVGRISIGDFLKTQFFEGEEDALSSFVFSDAPKSATPGESLSFKIQTKDKAGNTVPNYLGTVRFSSSDESAQLPSDYTFDEADQGEHFFALAATFNTPGEHTLVVHDLTDFRRKGELTFRVGEATKTEATRSINIQTPLPGEYSTPKVNVSGLAPNVDLVKIYDGPTLLIENLPVGPEADYFFQTPVLAEGTHIFQSMSMDEGVKSKKVRITIDRSAPKAVAIDLPSNPIAPGAEFMIKITSDEVLSQAQCVFNEKVLDLSLSGSTFETFVKAPLGQGEYPVSCTVSDLLGNEVEQQNAGIITVKAAKQKEADPTKTQDIATKKTNIDDNLDPLDLLNSAPESDKLKTNDDSLDSLDLENIPPTAIINLQTEPGNERVTLYWSPAKDDKGIAKYHIKYGLSADNLRENNMTPDNRTRWYVDGLTNGIKYYFQVTAIDTDDAYGIASNIADGTPRGDEPLYSAAVELEETGPGLDISIFMVSLILMLSFGFMYLAYTSK